MMLKKPIFEFLGTLLLVLIGTGSVAATEYFNIEYAALFIGVGFGIAVYLPIILFGSVSGAHLNPTVSIALFVGKKIDSNTLYLYLMAQSLGAVVGSFLVRSVFSSTSTIGLTQPSGSYLESFVLEFFLTLILMLVILYSTSIEKLTKYAPLLIAGTVALEAYFFGAICGASMNPARSLGPAVISLNFSNLELYFIAPIAGALFATCLFKLKLLKK